MWNQLKNFVQRINQEGRDKFARLASDEERRSATAGNAALMAGLVSSLVTVLYFALAIALVLIFARGAIGNPALWLRLLYFSMFLGTVQGGAAGAVLGWGQSLYWQGKRHKAGTICATGGGVLLALLALYQAQYYAPEFPLHLFVFWAFVLFSPGYLAGLGVVAWGLSLLAEKQ